MCGVCGLIATETIKCNKIWFGKNLKEGNTLEFWA